MIIIYNFIIFLINPILFFYFKHRKKIGKENLEKFDQKLGIYKIKDSNLGLKLKVFRKKQKNKKLIWFHAVSVGETLSIIPLNCYFKILLVQSSHNILNSKNELVNLSLHYKQFINFIENI